MNYPVTPVQTAHALRQEMEGAGFPSPAIDVAVNLTAENRHWWRVERTLAAVAEYALGELEEPPRLHLPGRGYLGPQQGPDADADDLRSICVLLALDLHGTGGPGGRGGVGATTRMPWARELGAGRWRAQDGGAWEAAAKRALVIAREQLMALAPDADPVASSGRGVLELTCSALTAEHEESVHQDADGPWYRAHALYLLAEALKPSWGSSPAEPTDEILALSRLVQRIDDLENEAACYEARCREVSARHEEIGRLLFGIRLTDGSPRYDGTDLCARGELWAATRLSPEACLQWEIEGVEPAEAEALYMVGVTPAEASEDDPDHPTAMLFESLAAGRRTANEIAALMGRGVVVTSA